MDRGDVKLQLIHKPHIFKTFPDGWRNRSLENFVYSIRHILVNIIKIMM